MSQADVAETTEEEMGTAMRSRYRAAPSEQQVPPAPQSISPSRQVQKSELQVQEHLDLLARTQSVVFSEGAVPSEMLSGFLSEPFPGDTRLFSCPQRGIFCLFVLCLWPLGTVCFYDFIAAGRADDLSEAQSAWFLHQWPL